jgi:hypothetical protein
MEHLRQSVYELIDKDIYATARTVKHIIKEQLQVCHPSWLCAVLPEVFYVATQSLVLHVWGCCAAGWWLWLPEGIDTICRWAEPVSLSLLLLVLLLSLLLRCQLHRTWGSMVSSPPVP